MDVHLIFLFLPQFGHKMSTLRHLFDTLATGGVSKLLFMCTNAYRYISRVFDTEKYFFFPARVKKNLDIYTHQCYKYPCLGKEEKLLPQ